MADRERELHDMIVGMNRRIDAKRAEVWKLREQRALLIMELVDIVKKNPGSDTREPIKETTP